MKHESEIFIENKRILFLCQIKNASKIKKTTTKNNI